MIKYIEFLHRIYTNESNESKKMDFLRSLIITEAKINNDLVEVILKTGTSDIINKTPEIFQQFETSSFDLISSLGVDIEMIFLDKSIHYKSYTEIQKLSNKEQFKKRSKSELYAFYIRKLKLLHKLSKANAINIMNIRVESRLKNVAYATHFITKEQENGK